MFKKIASLTVTLGLLISALPASADGGAPLQAEALIGAPCGRVVVPIHPVWHGTGNNKRIVVGDVNSDGTYDVVVGTHTIYGPSGVPVLAATPGSPRVYVGGVGGFWRVGGRWGP